MRSNEDIVLASIIPRKKADGTIASNLDYVLSQRVDKSYFSGPYEVLWDIAVEASLFEEGELDTEMVSAMCDNLTVDGELKQQTMLLFLDLKSVEVTRDKVKVVLPQLKEIVHSDRLAETIQRAATVLDSGAEIDGERLQGYKDSRSYIMHSLAELERADAGMLPAQEIREGVTDFLDEYAKAKQQTDFGILTGFKAVDELTRGIQKGEVWVWCGYTGEGKSQKLLNTAYNSGIKYGKNVVYVSLEMPLAQVRRRLYVRHTNDPKFAIPGGLYYKRVKEGSLNVDQERILYEASNDFATNPDYGRIHVMQVSKSETVNALREKLTYVRSRGPIDLLVLDYASLMTGIRKRSSRQDEIVEVIEGLKSLALTFNDGEGLALLTANQISRNAKEEADKLGRYGINFASETSAIEKNADLLGWILRTDEMKANHEAKLGISKYRDGDVLSEFICVEHYASGLLVDLDTDEAQIRF